jgi:hypothetical protein
MIGERIPDVYKLKLTPNRDLAIAQFSIATSGPQMLTAGTFSHQIMLNISKTSD